MVQTNFNPFDLINDELRIIKDQLSELAETQTTSPKTEIISGETLCKRLEITRQTLGRWRVQKRIPFIEVGRVIRYDFPKVVEALEKGRILK
ncbi:MAG TPA: hypothetical protein VL088_15700 [Pedobacter sp.]|nr:hypothetical protein [Pedobacter sp.]